MKTEIMRFVVFCVMVLFGLSGCDKPLERVKGGATMLSFTEYEKDVEPYKTRLLVTDDFMRFDDGEGSRDFILFDRRKEVIYSVNSSDRTVMAVTRQNVKVKPPFKLNLEHKLLTDMQDAPTVAGRKPEHHQFLANGDICYDVITIPGMFPDVVEAMHVFTEILASDSAVTFNAIPADMHDACEMSMSTFAAGRHLQFGFPVQEWSKKGSGRSLIDFQENYQVMADLFVLPKDYKHYTVQEFRDGKVSFDD